ncbi:MAG: hypothetical protein AAGD32_00380 [Planctomycetota bacterium]
MTKTIQRFIAVAALALVGVGCNKYASVNPTVTPGYTLQQRDIEIARNIDMEGKMLLDDADKYLLTRPVSQLTYWNVRKMSP